MTGDTSTVQSLLPMPVHI